MKLSKLPSAKDLLKLEFDIEDQVLSTIVTEVRLLLNMISKRRAYNSRILGSHFIII